MKMYLKVMGWGCELKRGTNSGALANTVMKYRVAIKYWKFLERLSNCRRLNKDTVPKALVARIGIN
jgi:hypothetical protein